MARAARGELDGVEIEDGALYIARMKPAVPEAARDLAIREQIVRRPLNRCGEVILVGANRATDDAFDTVGCRRLDAERTATRL